MVDTKPKQAPAREQDLRTQIKNLQNEVHQLQNYFAQSEAYTCSTYVNQEDETMANIKLALDSIQLELDVIAEHLNMDQPLASYVSTPLHDTFPIYTVQKLGGILVADDLPLRVEEKEPSKSNMSHYMLSEETDGAFMPKPDDLYGREQTQSHFMDYGKEFRKVKKKRHRPYVRVRSTTIGPETPAF
jgi:hypothetical protein